MSSQTTDIKYDFVPANPDPGDDYDKWRERCLNAFTKSDDRGWSLADHMLGIDEGGPAGPAIAAGAQVQKAQQALRKRQKDTYPVNTTVWVSLAPVFRSTPRACVCARRAPLRISKHGVSDDLEHLAAVEPSGGGGFVIADEAFRRGDAGAQRG